jgi:hypothetical protein
MRAVDDLDCSLDPLEERFPDSLAGLMDHAVVLFTPPDHNTEEDELPARQPVTYKE